jgi:hypothetical protein
MDTLNTSMQLLREAVARTDFDRADTLTTEVFGSDPIGMLLIDSTIADAGDEKTAMQMNRKKQRPFPLYVDSNTYKVLLRCLLEGKALNALNVDGLDCCSLFKRYLPVMHTEPSIAIHKLPAENKDPNKDNPPEWEVFATPAVFDNSIAFRNKDKPRLLKAVHQRRGDVPGENTTQIAISSRPAVASMLPSMIPSSTTSSSSSAGTSSLSDNTFDDEEFNFEDLDYLNDDFM